ncbi:hypothetical protein ETAA8_11950 [Anatilimnocola aggregata]|uniref:DUF1559 domain-containing protein n=1 Tax=Anatilimnocola aggregata TaxID=2528021 RepID=A0A517Y7B5_9BACT|nr:DUF1559 domain-containing protein [Anatilimnocola aggregata]QDU26121.1 hypothetical protein ETAA8_11950 [Anatilimnocola aggregata]
MSYVSRKNHSGFTLVELLVVIAIIGVLIALLLPAVQTARESARRTHCFNNLKQLGIATHNFHQQYNRLPPYWSENNVAKNPDGGWIVGLLPFMEQQTAYDTVLGSNNGRMTTTRTVNNPDESAGYVPGYWTGRGPYVPNPPQPGGATNHMGHTFPRDPVNSGSYVPPGTYVGGSGTAPTYDYGNTGIMLISSHSFSALHCVSDPSSIQSSKRINWNPLNSGYAAVPWVTTNYQANYLGWVMDAGESRVGVQWDVGTGKPPVAPKLDAVMAYKDITDGLSNTIMFGEGMRFCDGTYRFAYWSKYAFQHSHNFGVEWNGKANTFMFQSMPHRTRCNNWRLQGLHFGTLSTVLFDGSVKSIQKEISRRETSDPDFPTVGVDAAFTTNDPSTEFDGTWDRLMMPSDAQPLGSF